MCSRIKVMGAFRNPGMLLQYNTLTGLQLGKWGFLSGQIYNVRKNKLSTTWNGFQRGVIQIDCFLESKSMFSFDNDQESIAIIYNPKKEFAIVTTDADEVVSTVHHRMPLILGNNEEWMRSGFIIPYTGNIFQNLN